MKKDLLTFIKMRLQNKWDNFSDTELEEIINEYITVDEIHIGDCSFPSVKHAITYEEINTGKVNILLNWCKNNLHDDVFWCKIKTTINNYIPSSNLGILILILHFSNQNDAYLFKFYWK